MSALPDAPRERSKATPLWPSLLVRRDANTCALWRAIAAEDGFPSPFPFSQDGARCPLWQYPSPPPQVRGSVTHTQSSQTTSAPQGALVRRYLEKSGELEHTYVIVSSDHGYNLGQVSSTVMMTAANSLPELAVHPDLNPSMMSMPR